MPSILVARTSLQQRRATLDGRCGRTVACAAREEKQQYGRLSELPPLALQRVVACLDPASRLELRKVSKLCRHAVDAAWKLVCIPLDQVKRHDMEQLALQFPASNCVVISAPENPVSLSILGRRRRCEHLLSVLLDNTVRQPANLQALDLSHAVSSITSATLQLLVAALPALRHLALPAVAGVGSNGQWEVLRQLGQLQHLQSCELDCTYFALQGRHSGRRQQTPQGNLQNQLQETGVLETVETEEHMLPPLPQQQQGMLSMEAQHQNCKLLGLAWDTTQQVPAMQASPAAQHSRMTASDCTDSSSQADCEALHTHVQQQLMISGNIAMYSTTTAASARSSMQQVVQQQKDPEQLPVCQLLPLQPQPCRPWANLCNFSRLQQLQLSHPCALRDLFDNLSSLKVLRSLSLVRVNRECSSVLLDPGLGLADGGVGCVQGLEQLSCLQQLTRLDLGFDSHCSCSSSQLQKLITPPHISTNELHHSPSPVASITPTTTAAVHSPSRSQLHTASSLSFPAAGLAFSHHICCWSHLSHLRVLSLSGGICLDMPLLAATADCVQLTELRASGVLLESSAPVAFKGLQELRVLIVTQRFDLGCNTATAMFPALERLSIKDDSMQCPDLACLKHHSSLASLAIEAPNTGWQLSSLQLGYLVHIDTLKQLSLAGRCWGPGHDHAGQQHSGPNHLVAGGSPGVASRSPGALRSGMSVTTQPSSSSHWLPTATLTQVTSLTLAGPANDHTLSQIPNQFPGLVTLQLLGSYYASDWGLKRLCRAPHLESLLLEGCEHVTEYGLEALMRGGSIKVLAVHGCGGVDERACQRIRRACRHSCANLSWHGTDGLQHLQHLHHHHSKHTSGSNSSVNSSSTASGWATSSVASADSHHDLSFFDTDGQHCSFGSSNAPSGPAGEAAVGVGNGSSDSSSKKVFGGQYQCSSGSEFLERCWRESLAAQQDADGGLCAAVIRGNNICRGASRGSPAASSRRCSPNHATSGAKALESSAGNGNPSEVDSSASAANNNSGAANGSLCDGNTHAWNGTMETGEAQQGSFARGMLASNQRQQNRHIKSQGTGTHAQTLSTADLLGAAAAVLTPETTDAGKDVGNTTTAAASSNSVPVSCAAMPLNRSSSSSEGRRGSWGCNSSHVSSTTQRTSLSGCAR